MRVDITLGVPRPPDDGDDPLDGIIAGSTLGAMLARMAFDYPDQMLARIKTDHGDGTYTCDRPGTNILMKMVPSNSPELAEQLAVGMTVVIKFYNRDRRRPFIWRVGGGLGGTYPGWFHTWATLGAERSSAQTSGASSTVGAEPIYTGWGFAGSSLRVVADACYFIAGRPATDSSERGWALMQAGAEWSQEVAVEFPDHSSDVPYQLDIELTGSSLFAMIAWGGAS